MYKDWIRLDLLSRAAYFNIKYTQNRVFALEISQFIISSWIDSDIKSKYSESFQLNLSLLKGQAREDAHHFKEIHVFCARVVGAWGGGTFDIVALHAGIYRALVYAVIKVGILL